MPLLSQVEHTSDAMHNHTSEYLRQLVESADDLHLPEWVRAIIEAELVLRQYPIGLSAADYVKAYGVEFD